MGLPTKKNGGVIGAHGEEIGFGGVLLNGLKELRMPAPRRPERAEGRVTKRLEDPGSTCGTKPWLYGSERPALV